MMRARQHPVIASAVELARLRAWREVWVTRKQCCFSLGGATRLLVDARPGGPVSVSLSFQPDAHLGLETPEALASEVGAQLVNAALAAVRDCCENSRAPLPDVVGIKADFLAMMVRALRAGDLSGDWVLPQRPTSRRTQLPR